MMIVDTTPTVGRPAFHPSWDLDQSLLVANLATFPIEALRDFARVLPGDVRKCRKAGRHSLAGRLSNILDETRRLLQAHAKPA